MRLLRLAPLAVLLLAGCAGFKLSYNHLDFIAGWQVNRFVDLEPTQKRLFDDRFDDFWRWHRGTQLELYAADLRELIPAVERPLTAAQVQVYLERSREHLGRAMREAVPDTARLLQTLDDAQAAELVENLAERRRERAEEERDLDENELRERAAGQMEDNLERWIGSLSRDQLKRVDRWAAERRYAGTIWAQYQEAWAAAFAQVLVHRHEPDFPKRLGELFREPRLPGRAEMQALQDHNRGLWVALLADLSGTLTERQRRHLRERLATVADDLDELSRQ